jgi:hypothetical protein
MSNPAFIVDGFTEKLIIQNICPGRPISRTDLNGKNVTIEAIAKKMASLIRLFNNRNYPIIIIIDKENRQQSIYEIAELLYEKLQELNINCLDLRIGVADRMVENWIVADWNSLNVTEPKPQNTDGIHSVSIIKRLRGSYNKTTDGVDMFLHANPSEMYNNSESFRTFVDKLDDLDCNHLNLK